MESQHVHNTNMAGNQERSVSPKIMLRARQRLTKPRITTLI
ncbi:unnamed protein product [Spirodela intermedia]|uniref:Uncharacterized protein n=1 Tax=Spirodela intermedia TaxID=51605 RepID=A0A7I8KRM1_SPIIN|nr:unnamed protein product [Spirodela intermedia]